MSRPIEAIVDPTAEFGRTAADALAFLDRAEVVLLGVRTREHAVAVYLAVAPAAVRPAIAAYDPSVPMPCEFAPSRRELTLGSWTAINRPVR